MKLDDIGFYTLSEKRAMEISATSPIKRVEIILGGRCNFSCKYCRGIRSDYDKELTLIDFKKIIDILKKDNLENIRFSGGEPTIYDYLPEAIKYAKDNGVKRIAISTNGSANLELYKNLIDMGANDFSISLDACCAKFGDIMSGNVGAWQIVVKNIEELSKLTYVTVGIVLTNDNVGQAKEIIEFADKLGVADIRVITAAQNSDLKLSLDKLDKAILNRHPILKYRMENLQNDIPIRGLDEKSCKKCYLMMDDIAICGDYQFPCIIYMREQGDPVGKVCETMREDRIKWIEEHDITKDKICKTNCLDVCSRFISKIEEYKKLQELAKEANITIVTAKQMQRPDRSVIYPKKINESILIDYIDVVQKG